MAQNVERAKAVKLARKFMNISSERGSSLAETQFAMDRLAEIRETFDLSLDEIVLENLEYVEKTVEATAVKGDPMHDIIMSIADFTDTKTWRSPGKTKYVQAYDSRRGYYSRRSPAGPAKYHFFGLEEDVEMAVFLYDMIVNNLKKEEAKFMRSSEYRRNKIRGGKRRMLVSFRKGFIANLRFRLNQLDLDRENKHAHDLEKTGNDLVFDKQNVRERKFEEQLGIKLVSRRSYSRGASSGTGYSAGRSASANVSFNRPVSGGGQKLLG